LRYYNTPGKFGQDALLQKFEDNKLVEQIEAERVFWQKPGWLFVNGRERVFSDSLEEKGSEQFKPFEHLLRLDLKITPEALEKRAKPTDEMTYGELKEFILAKKRTGQDTAVEQTDLHLKISFPLVSFIIVLVGSTFAANPRRSGMAVGIAVSLFISFVYYTLIRAGQSLGYSHKLPSFIAAWMTNVLFFVLGIVLFIRAKK
jgi:lipopolysaccharide export system permease protein